jgi:glucosamine--fructose-6-phosphate aminotransferase (isomerizing)
MSLDSLESTHVYREIHEQPEVMRRLLTGERTTMVALADAMRNRAIDHVFIAARGTSDNAARYAQYLLGAANQLPVALAAPSLFIIYEAPPRFGATFVLGISQSGKSPDIVGVLAEAQRQGALTAAITNAPESDLAHVADFVIDLHAEEEKAVAATKTYTAELGAIALLSACLNGDAAQMEALMRAPDFIAETLALQSRVAAIAERYRYMTSCVTIGRGFNYATAFELALKLKEMTYTMVEPYSSADFLHGPFALIQGGFPVIVIAPSGKMLPELKAFMATAGAANAELLAISDDAAVLGMARTALPLPGDIPEWLSPIPAIIPGQLFAMHLAWSRDLDPDHPRGLKKVTETF